MQQVSSKDTALWNLLKCHRKSIFHSRYCSWLDFGARLTCDQLTIHAQPAWPATLLRGLDSSGKMHWPQHTHLYPTLLVHRSVTVAFNDSEHATLMCYLTFLEEAHSPLLANTWPDKTLRSDLSLLFLCFSKGCTSFESSWLRNALGHEEFHFSYTFFLPTAPETYQ